jgi:hypothetical protein
VKGLTPEVHYIKLGAFAFTPDKIQISKVWNWVDFYNVMEDRNAKSLPDAGGIRPSLVYYRCKCLFRLPPSPMEWRGGLPGKFHGPGVAQFSTEGSQPLGKNLVDYDPEWAQSEVQFSLSQAPLWWVFISGRSMHSTQWA